MKIKINTQLNPEEEFIEVDVDASATVADLKAKIKDALGHDIEKQRLVYNAKSLVDDSRTLESYPIKGWIRLLLARPVIGAPADNDIEPVPMPEGSRITLNTAAYSMKALRAEYEAALADGTAAIKFPPLPANLLAKMSLPKSAPTSTATATFADTFADTPSAPPVITGATTSFPTPAAASSPTSASASVDTSVDTPAATSFSIPATSPPTTSASTFASTPANTSTLTPTPPTISTLTTPIPTTTLAPTAAPPPVVTGTTAPSSGDSLFVTGDASQATSASGAGVPGAGLSGLGGIAAFVDNPQPAQIRELLSQNPALLQLFARHIAESDPEHAQLLGQNPELLLEFLDAMSEGNEEGRPRPGAQTVSVTEEERAAIERLKALGFPEQAVIQAYLVCDKNEELAANYLLENGFGG